MKKTIAFIAFLLLSLISFSSCTVHEPRSTTYYDFFDTKTVISSYSNDSQAKFKENCDAVSELFSHYHKLFDIYNEYDGINNLCTVNKNAGISPVKVDKRLLDFLLYAIDVCKKTELEINIAMGSVLSLWHTAREYSTANEDKAYIPSESSLIASSKHMNIDSIVIDKNASTVYISDKETSIDVGAIGKGYAVKMASQLLRARGANGYIIDAGGNIEIIGSKENGKSFITGITNPKKDHEKPFALTIDILDTACVTSGDYERFYTVNGTNYHHIIDKDTLMPSEHFSSVTVVCKDSAIADALSTALFCMSYDDGIMLISKFDDVDVFWICKNGEMRMTDGFNSLISK